MKNVLILLLFIIFASQSFGRGAPKPNIPQNPIVVEVPQTEIASNNNVVVKFKIIAKPEHITKIAKYRDPIQKIINSEKFKSRVLNAWYKGKSQFVSTKMTNAEVYAVIMNANELKTGNDHVALIQIGVDKARCSTLGWTTSNDPKFYFNSCSFDKRSDSGLVGTIGHEWMHKLGFDHDSNRTARREYSVPYAIGTIFAELYKEFI